MGLNLTANILTSGFLVSVVVFFVLMGYFLLMAYSKIGQVLEQGDSRRNNLEKLDKSLNDVRIAYILAFIAAGMSLLLAFLYAGHETIFAPSEYWHMALYFITYALMVISVIYAFIALNKLYDVSIEDRNGADSYIWASLFVVLFAFMGLTATSTGRLGMNIARSGAKKRLDQAEGKINEHLPAIRSQVERVKSKVESDIPVIRSKVDQLHEATLSNMDMMSSPSIPVSSSPMINRSVISSPTMGSPLPQPTSSNCPGNLPQLSTTTMRRL